MDSTWWPAAVPEVFRRAADQVLGGDDGGRVLDRLCQELGFDAHRGQGYPDRQPVLASEGAGVDAVAMAVVRELGGRLTCQYPSSSLLIDAVADETDEVLRTFGFDDDGQGAWNRHLDGGRTAVIERRLRPGIGPDQYCFTLSWGVALRALPFCGHTDAHRIACCAVAGGLGSVRQPHGDHLFRISLGVLVEQTARHPDRLVGRQAYRGRLHRLGAFCGRFGEIDELAAVVTGQPWRAGIGIAEQLRDADPASLRRLLA